MNLPIASIFTDIPEAIIVFFHDTVGLGWGPAEVATHPERLALVGLAVAGLIWPVVVLRLAGRYRGVDDSKL